MGHQIIKNLRTEDGKIKCEMCSNNVSPKSYTTWEREDTDETRDMVRGFLRDRVWQPQHANAFIQGLGVYRYFDGTPTPWGVKRTAKGCGYWQMNGAYQKEYDELWTKLVPGIGDAETTNGELLRTSAKLYHDYFNNGNMNAQDREYYDEDDEDAYETRVSEYYQQCLNFLRNTCKQDYELQGLLQRVEEIILECCGGKNDADDEHTYDLMVDHVIYWVLTHDDTPANPFAKMKH